MLFDCVISTLLPTQNTMTTPAYSDNYVTEENYNNHVLIKYHNYGDFVVVVVLCLF